MSADDQFDRVTLPAGIAQQAVMSILAEAGMDPTPPIDPAMLIAIGIRVRRSRYLLPHQMLVMGEFERPAGWASMSGPQKVAESLKRGAILFIHDTEE